MIRHVRHALSPASRRAAQQHWLPIVALLNVILARLRYIVASDLSAVVWYDGSPAADAHTADAQTQVDLAISATIINLLLDLYLPGAALLVWSALYGTQRLKDDNTP